jgi:hypothetical protein
VTASLYLPHFAPIDENLKKEAFKHLSHDELQILIALEPINDEQKKAKEILDIIKSGQDVDLRFSQANCLQQRFAIASLNQEEKDNLFCYLPHEYRGLLRRD